MGGFLDYDLNPGQCETDDIGQRIALDHAAMDDAFKADMLGLGDKIDVNHSVIFVYFLMQVQALRIVIATNQAAIGVRKFEERHERILSDDIEGCKMAVMVGLLHW